MDLSQPHIAIRQRTLLEIFDLTLHVYRDHWKNILMMLVINALPLVIANAVVCHVLHGDRSDLPTELMISLLLIVSQAQIGTLLITQYLGTAMFAGKPTIRQTVSNFFSTSKSWIWNHGFIRMVLPIFALVAAFHINSMAMVIFLLFIALTIRALRPFISEILILEKPPRRIPKDATLSGITLRRRASDLHRGDVVAGFFLSCLVGSGLLVTVTSLFFHVDTAMGLNGAWDSPIHYVYWPLGAWLVASFLAVFRFLCYINTRITQEGWEIKIKLMAERQKLLAEDEY
jgi:hypothetical protein